METKYVLELNADHIATITLTGSGQQPPDEGNKVTVMAKLALPTDEFGNLIRGLRFGDITINEPLDVWWGHTGEGCRYVTKKFHGKTWKKARARAAEWAREELNPLRGALAERAQSLADAGDWE